MGLFEIATELLTSSSLSSTATVLSASVTMPRGLIQVIWLQGVSKLGTRCRSGKQTLPRGTDRQGVGSWSSKEKGTERPDQVIACLLDRLLD